MVGYKGEYPRSRDEAERWIVERCHGNVRCLNSYRDDANRSLCRIDSVSASLSRVSELEAITPTDRSNFVGLCIVTTSSS